MIHVVNQSGGGDIMLEEKEEKGESTRPLALFGCLLHRNLQNSQPGKGGGDKGIGEK